MSDDIPKQFSPTPAPMPVQATGETSYEWSTTRVVEGVTINVASALIIGIGGIIVAAFYALIVLVANALHTPSGLLGMVALFILGGILTLVIVIIVIWALIRKTSPSIVVGMAIGGLVGAAIAAATEREGGITGVLAKHAPQAQKENAKAEANNPRK
jgi:hypothetical protein